MSTPESQTTTATSAPAAAAPVLPVNPSPGPAHALATASANPALQIADLCLLAGFPERTAEFLARGVGEDVVRRELLAARVQGAVALNSQGGHARFDATHGEITSHIAPRSMQLGGVPAPAALSLDQNPVVLAAQGRAASSR